MRIEQIATAALSGIAVAGLVLAALSRIKPFADGGEMVAIFVLCVIAVVAWRASL